MSDRRPYLIQRLYLRDPTTDTRRGIDRYFQCDYMGSSEFEWGALPRALRELRALPFHGWKRTTIIEFGLHVVRYVGPDDCLTLAADLFRDQMSNRRAWRFKEYTGIRESFTGVSDFGGRSPPSRRFDGWWAIDSSFALFRTEAAATAWFAGLADAPPAPPPTERMEEGEKR